MTGGEPAHGRHDPGLRLPGWLAAPVAFVVLAGASALLHGGGDPPPGADPSPTSAETGAEGCDRFADISGSDRAAGTEARPFRSVQRLADALRPEQIGCIRAGTYATDPQIKLETPRITLRSASADRATVRGRLWIARGADGVRIESLNLDGRNPNDNSSPTINAADVVIRDNDITNEHTSICLLLGNDFGDAKRTLVEGNRIHDCGTLPRTNLEHGIYVGGSDDAVIRNNEIFGNADLGIALYPDAQDTRITGNVIDRNGKGIAISGDDGTASSGTLIENNAITNSTAEYNVYSYWPEGNPVPHANVVRENCVFGAPGFYGGKDNAGVERSAGFIAVDNIVASPEYADRGSGDFRLPAGTTCAELLARGR